MPFYAHGQQKTHRGAVPAVVDGFAAVILDVADVTETWPDERGSCCACQHGVATFRRPRPGRKQKAITLAGNAGNVDGVADNG